MSDFNQIYFTIYSKWIALRLLWHHGYQFWHQHDAILTFRRHIFCHLALFRWFASRDIHNWSAIWHLIGLKFYHNAWIGPECANINEPLWPFVDILDLMSVIFLPFCSLLLSLTKKLEWMLVKWRRHHGEPNGLSWNSIVIYVLEACVLKARKHCWVGLFLKPILETYCCKDLTVIYLRFNCKYSLRLYCHDFDEFHNILISESVSNNCSHR